MKQTNDDIGHGPVQNTPPPTDRGVARDRTGRGQFRPLGGRPVWERRLRTVTLSTDQVSADLVALGVVRGSLDEGGTRDPSCARHGCLGDFDERTRN